MKTKFRNILAKKSRMKNKTAKYWLDRQVVSHCESKQIKKNNKS